MKTTLKIAFIAIFSFMSICSYSQTAGLIFENANGVSPLDPNGDGYVSKLSTGFPANQLPTDIFDILFSEIPYVAIPKVDTEPTSDLGPGPDCFFTDMVPAADGESTYYYNDGTNMLFRFRLGGTAPNSKGYSVLIDTDEKFGFTGPNKDPNATVGNPGFEVEIVLRTNFGISVYNIDGTVGGTEIGTFAARPYATFAQKSLALTTNCDDPDYFYDFYVPFADLISLAGTTSEITSTTKIRMVTLTVINPRQSSGNNGVSDVGGVDDTTGNLDDLTGDIIDNQTPTDGTPGDPPLPRADCPGIDGIVNGATSVTGTSTEADTTVIEVFKNGVSIGTTTVSGGTWTLSSIAPALATDDLIKATATVPASTGTEKGTSVDNCDVETVTLVGCTLTPTPIVTGIGGSGGKDLEGTVDGSMVGKDVLIRIFNNGTEVTSWSTASTDGATGYFTATIAAGGAWKISGGGGFKAPSGYYSISMQNITDANWCFSDPPSNSFAYCNTGGGGDGTVTEAITLTESVVCLVLKYGYRLKLNLCCF